MKTLFAISIVALFALLWASISIAQHIRRARRRRRLKESNDEIFKSAGDDKTSEHHTPPPPPPFNNRMERVDWAYFNKDLGDLTDPYQGPRNRPKGQSPS
jgi:hypothetical protein